LLTTTAWAHTRCSFARRNGGLNVASPADEDRGLVAVRLRRRRLRGSFATGRPVADFADAVDDNIPSRIALDDSIRIAIHTTGPTRPNFNPGNNAIIGRNTQRP
jgi:hypothetical protein